MKFHPNEIIRDFVFVGGMLYRKMQDGTLHHLKTVDRGQLVVMYKRQRILGIDITWCLHYGNWPKFPLHHLSQDPFDLRIETIYPARVKKLRYRVTRGLDGLYRHSMSHTGHETPDECWRNWAVHARSHYLEDLPYVVEVERREREMRRNSEPAGTVPELVHSADKLREKSRVKGVLRPPKPEAPEGMRAYWYKNMWVVAPVAAHVADDYRARCQAALEGKHGSRYEHGRMVYF